MEYYDFFDSSQLLSFQLNIYKIIVDYSRLIFDNILIESVICNFRLILKMKNNMLLNHFQLYYELFHNLNTIYESIIY